MHTCRACGVPKDESEFYASYPSKCKACVQAASAARYAADPDGCNAKKRQHYRDNREAILAQQHDYYERHRDEIVARVRRWQQERPDEVRAWFAAHYEAHKDAISRRQAAYYEEHREAVGKRVAAYTKANRVRANGWSAAYRARKLAATTEKVDYAEVLRLHGRICHICKKPIPDEPRQLHFEHVEALILGGEHSYANVKPSHWRCNLRKGRRAELPEWLVDELLDPAPTGVLDPPA